MAPAARLLAALLAIGALVVAAAGCGPADNADAPPHSDARLILDFTPNGVHAGVYLALQRGYDEAEGVRLRVDPPSTSSDAVKLLSTGREDFAILDIHDLAIAREKGSRLVAVMAIVQDPLAAVLAQPSIRRPRDLAGRRVGVTGLPSDDAVLSSIVAGDGGDPAAVRRTTIGFTAVPALLSGKVAGATAFWNVEGLALRARRPAAREFRVDQFGAPRYPELVLAVTRTTLRQNPQLVRATVRALRTGYERAIIDPPAAVGAILDAQPDLDRDDLTRQLEAVAPSFVGAGSRYGALHRDALLRWAAWEQRFGIVEHRPDVDSMFSIATSRIDD